VRRVSARNYAACIVRRLSTTHLSAALWRTCRRMRTLTRVLIASTASSSPQRYTSPRSLVVPLHYILSVTLPPVEKIIMLWLTTTMTSVRNSLFCDSDYCLSTAFRVIVLHCCDPSSVITLSVVLFNFTSATDLTI